MKHLAAAAACALAALLAPPQALGMTIVYSVDLSGTQSVPANASTATGSATVTVDDVADTVGVELTFAGLSGGNASAAHIHCCVATDANGPVVIPFTGFPSASSGTYSHLFTGVSAANIAGIEAGQAYINIHNTVFPGGEIRANILAAPVPEPSSAWLTVAGLAAIALLRSHRTRRTVTRIAPL